MPRSTPAVPGALSMAGGIAPQLGQAASRFPMASISPTAPICYRPPTSHGFISSLAMLTPRGDQRLASALSELARLLYSPSDTQHGELVYGHQDHPAWAVLGSWFEPVSLDSRPPRHASRARTAQHTQHKVTRQGPPVTATELREGLDNAVAGDEG